MPRIIVTTDPVPSQLADAHMLLDERVHSVHLSTGHAAAQLVERLAWAISDAEDAERAESAESARSDRHARPDRQAARRRANPHLRVRQPVRA
jgi:hypothetical protein